MGVSNAQIKSGIEKREHPELYCRAPKCLWKIKTSDGRDLRPCERHPVPMSPKEERHAAD